MSLFSEQSECIDMYKIMSQINSPKFITCAMCYVVIIDVLFHRLSYITLSPLTHALKDTEACHVVNSAVM